LFFYPQLFSIAIILKQFMFANDFDGVYEGGLSSYYVVAMIVAFLRKKQDHFY